MLARRMLSKEEEAQTQDTEVTKEDQDKINAFSRLHSKEKVLEDELQTKQKDKEDLEEVSTELELADEDELVPYQIGDSFVSLPLPEVQEMLAESIQQTDKDISVIEESLSSMRDEMKDLKAKLYARFGKGINLET